MNGYEQVRLPKRAEDSMVLIAPSDQFPAWHDAVAASGDPRLHTDDKVLADSTLYKITPEELQGLLATVETEDDGLDPLGAVDLWLKFTQLPEYATTAAETVSDSTGLTLSEHISKRWTDLTSHQTHDSGTLFGTANPHLKAGKRFNEGYYWDTSDGVEGLIVEAQLEIDPAKRQAIWDQIFGVLKNFA